MNEPSISTFDKPLTMDERKYHVPINFEDFDYVIAVDFIIFHDYEFLDSLPPQVGSIKASVKSGHKEATKLNLVKCD